MTKSFSTIAVLGRTSDPEIAKALQSLLAYLDSQGVRTLVDATLAPTFEGKVKARFADYAQISAQADLAIAIGGDGTLLNAVHIFTTHPIPLVGINLGRVGFLTDISPETMENEISAILKGNSHAEQRLLLESEIVRAGRSLPCMLALNDVVIQKADGGRLIEFETHVDGQFVCAHRADGIIIATPTGSTAYALSGGGAILHPSVDAVILVPICPHALGDRPIVLKGDSKIEIMINDTHGGGAQVSSDGQDTQPLAANDRVRVQRSAASVTLIHPFGHDYYRILRTKLHWGRAPHQTRKD
ncbi:MAG: NAD(+) kinase [Gammaproteobacteria bacterium]|nr:NAD(+) kinase [Gammaproteobacteria bacterium]